MALSKEGIQVFIATHSLFLLRELEILLSAQQYGNLKARFFGLHRVGDGARVQQGSTVDDIGNIAASTSSLSSRTDFSRKTINHAKASS